MEINNRQCFRKVLFLSSVLFVLLFFLSGFCGLAVTASAKESAPAEIKEIAKGAYIYAFPMIMN
ncbi:MAG TPA: hypothetical protein VFJ67_03675, partial [Thermodesulfobacteriota bacterium]|nr:hypothetical protein [Thermodesulfobacteriota bacterium]